MRPICCVGFRFPFPSAVFLFWSQTLLSLVGFDVDVLDTALYILFSRSTARWPVSDVPFFVWAWTSCDRGISHRLPQLLTIGCTQSWFLTSDHCRLLVSLIAFRVSFFSLGIDFQWLFFTSLLLRIFSWRQACFWLDSLALWPRHSHSLFFFLVPVRLGFLLVWLG